MQGSNLTRNRSSSCSGLMQFNHQYLHTLMLMSSSQATPQQVGEESKPQDYNTVIEQLVSHGRYIDSNTGDLKTHFLKKMDTLQPDIVSLDSTASSSITVSAVTITKRVCEYSASVGLDMSSMRGIATDGAATMLGRHNGVVTRLKAIKPSALRVHCAVHRLNLTSVHAGDAVPYI